MKRRTKYLKGEEMENTLKKYAVFRHPGHVLVGIESDGFTVIDLANGYGSGTYEVVLFNGKKLAAVYNQVVDARLGPPKKTWPLPEGLLPSTV